MNVPKIRTTNELSDYIQKELAWRRKELILIKSLLISQSGQQKALLRSAIMLLYAHWEGFIKYSATAYVRFVATQRLTYQELAPNFLAVALRTQIYEVGAARTAKAHNNFTNFITNNLPDRSNIIWKGAIDTESNLSSKVLANIIEQLGMIYLSQYQTKQKLLDESLLANRNKAAHGEDIIDIDIKGFLELFSVIVGDGENQGLLQTFGNQLMNAAVGNTYKR